MKCDINNIAKNDWNSVITVDACKNASFTLNSSLSDIFYITAKNYEIDGVGC